MSTTPRPGRDPDLSMPPGDVGSESERDQAVPDRRDRDVIAGRSGTDATVFVDAGAGTGKTTALVERVVTLVTDGVPVTRIAAITFTEAAAAELRHRVRTHLDCAAERLHGADGAREQAERISAALHDLDRATFTTLHAFAHRILAEHPIEAGLAPDFEVLGEIEEAAAFDLQWEAWLASFVDDAAIEPALAQMDLVGLTIPRVRILAEALHRDQARIPHDLPTPPTAYHAPELRLGDVAACLDDLDELVAHGESTAPADRLVPRLRAWSAAGHRLLELADDPTAGHEDRFRALQDVLDADKLGNVGTAAAWRDRGGAKSVRDRAKALPEACSAVLEAQADHLVRTLTGWTADFVTGWARRRRRDATLVFQDLLVLARDLLRDAAAVRDHVAGGLDHLLIDEFQDTDPVQIEIAVLLAARDPAAVAASADASGTVAWEEAELVPGRLFFVGDPKQSIYRFRGADIAVYEGAKEVVVADGGDLRHLTHNFRSVPGVLDWVNRVFDDLLEPQDRAQPAYLPLTAHRTAVATGPGDDARPAVRWFGGSTDHSAQDTRTAEANEVVGIVRSLVGTESVRDPVSGRVRPARAGDIAVLVRRHATARQLERCFDDAGLPLVVEARSLVFGTDEVRDLTNILTAIEDPNDGVAVVAALRHPALGCSDADLVTWRAAGGGWWVPDDPAAAPLPTGRRAATGAAVDHDHPVARALTRLARLRAERRDRTVGGVVHHVVDDLHLVELALAGPRPQDRWRRLRFVVDQAHAFHAAGGHLRGFVRWLRRQEQEGVRAHEHVLADPDDDAVRVTTVHAAKGLEYPIVIVLGLDTGTNKPPHDPRLLWAPDGSPESNLGRDLKTSGYARLLAGDERVVGARTHHQHEEARLFYVATTRASDVLVVSLHHSTRACQAAWLHHRQAGLGGLWDEQVPSPGGERRQPHHPAQEVATEDVRAFRDRHDVLVRAAGRPPVLAATTIAAQLADVGRPATTSAPTSPGPPTPSRPADVDRQLVLPFPDRATGHDDESAGPPSAGASTPAGTAATSGRVGGAPGRSRDPQGDRPDDPAPHDDDPDTGRPAWRRGRSGSAVGRAVHAVLQMVDLATLHDLDSLARAHCAIEGLPLDDAALVADRARRATEAPIVARAVAGGRIWREVHVGAPLVVAGPDGGQVHTTVEGFIDLLAEVDGHLVVVDWKTDRAVDDTPEEIAARYHPQAATYALALEIATGRPIARCVFVLTGVADPARRQVEVGGDDLDVAVRRLRDLVAVGEPTGPGPVA